jgi:hypothetical protein
LGAGSLSVAPVNGGPAVAGGVCDAPDF